LVVQAHESEHVKALDRLVFDLQRKEHELAQQDDEHAAMLALASASTSAAASAREEQEQSHFCKAQERLQKEHAEEIHQLEAEVASR
jgi:hypothetical protein